MSSQAVIDVEDRLASNGKGSRFNAIKHGLTAKTAVLPGESAEAFQAKIDGYKASLETRNELEEDLAEQAALASWQLARVTRAEVARLRCNMFTKPAADELSESLAAESLGNRLFSDRRGPIELYPSRAYESREARTSCSEVADDPDAPAKLILQLEASVAGCRWLLSRWNELKQDLESGPMAWQSHHKIKAIRLMGWQPIKAVSVREVAIVFLASHALKPQYRYAFQELRCDIHEDQFKIHKARLDEQNHQEITPANPNAARAVLLDIVEKATERLRMLESKHQEAAQAVGGLKTTMQGFEEGKAGEQIRRHLVSCNRLVLRNVDAVRKAHRDVESGWGKTRQERTRRNSEKPSRNWDDQRLVVDEHGDVKNICDYDGNLEEGLARFATHVGNQPCESADWQHDIDRTAVPAVPDFARWTAAEERRKAEDERMNQGSDAEPGFENGGEGVEFAEAVPLTFIEKGGRANLQNEMGKDDQVIEEGVGHIDGEPRGPLGTGQAECGGEPLSSGALPDRGTQTRCGTDTASDTLPGSADVMVEPTLADGVTPSSADVMVDATRADGVTLSDDVLAIYPDDSEVDNQPARPGEDTDRERGGVGDRESRIENPKTEGLVAGRNPATRLSRREKRRLRHEMESGRGGKKKTGARLDEEALRSIQGLLPNITRVLLEQLPKSP